jgi:two-component system NtrC family sensor kinase
MSDPSRGSIPGPTDLPPRERELEFHRELRRLILEFSQTVTSRLDLTEGLERLADRLTEMFDSRGVAVWLHDRRARDLVRAADTRARPIPAERISTDGREPLALAMRWERAGFLHDQAGAVIAIPLRGWRRALGVLTLDAPGRSGATDQELLDRGDELARQLSGAIENLQLLEEVLRSRRELEDTFNSLADLVAVCDRRQRLVHVNQAFASRVRPAGERIVDRPLSEFVGPATADWIASLAPAHSSGTRQAFTRDLEDPVLSGIFSITVTTLIGQEGQSMGSVMVARDITRQARLEAERGALRERLAQSEKLAALGQFVAGIAHELNNPLQGVLGHLELMLASRTLRPTYRRELRQVYREAERAAKIVRNLLVFAGSRRLRRRRISLNAVITRAIALRTRRARLAGIEIVRSADDVPRVLGDPLLLQQAFLNIVMNAEQAVGGPGGRIDVQTFYDRERGTVVTEVRDTGPGIPPDILPRIFDPFFTTKDVGKGTGLGLAITYGIIQEHGGEITARTAPGGGAVFRIELPPADGKVT